MMVSRDDIVRDIVVRDFRAALVFHRHGINFCCGGAQPLWEVCLDRRVPEQDVLDDLERACAAPETATPRFSDWEPETLVAYIVGAHHAYLRSALPAIAAHVQKLASSHGRRRPELQEVADIVETLVADLTSHMAREETIVFPFLVGAADAVRCGRELPVAPFGHIDRPLRTLEAEHEATGAALDRIRALTDGFRPRGDACTTCRICLLELEALQRDLRTHVHLENNVLFPRARHLLASASDRPFRLGADSDEGTLPCCDASPSPDR